MTLGRQSNAWVTISEMSKASKRDVSFVQISFSWSNRAIVRPDPSISGGRYDKQMLHRMPKTILLKDDNVDNPDVFHNKSKRGRESIYTRSVWTAEGQRTVSSEKPKKEQRKRQK